MLVPVITWANDPPAIAARAYFLLDVQSNQILAEHRAEERMEPASLTKLMTAYVVFGALKQKLVTAQQQITPSVNAWKTQGSRMFIEPNKPVSIDELLRGMIVQSGNDASLALAEAVAGDEAAFAKMMNREARRLGLKGSSFVNATGLPNEQHFSTAQDLVRLAAAVIRDFPEHYPLYSLREYTYNKITQPNRNLLLSKDPYVDGVKTGFTDNAGYCLIASARRESRRLVAVVLGAASETARAIEAQKLLNYGFQFFEGVRLYEKGAPVAKLQVWKGSEREVPVGFLDDYFVTVPRGQKDRLQAKLESVQPLLAPISTNQAVGTMRVTLAGKPFGERGVVSLANVSIANIFVRAWDSLRLRIK
ncbi:MAG: D-alanyl-D-alanine carboxypeptidase [Betaproteobacteria bacterium]|nr:D-alanyl-D-alanine carboxypeptidase [Betaproteobacteria bacterium]